MLSLKSTSTQHVAPSKTLLLDLPHELLRSILDHIYSLDDLFSASLVSKGFRDAVLPILYSSINLTFTNKIQRNGETILDFLSNNPHLHKHVRQLVMRAPPLRYEAQEPEFWKFERLSMNLENLRELRVCASNDLTLRVLGLPFAREDSIDMDLVVSNHNYSYYLQGLRDDQAVALTFRFFDAGLRRNLGVPDPRLLRPAEFGGAIRRFFALRSLSIAIKPEADFTEIPRLQGSFGIITEVDRALPALKDLHIELPTEKCPQMDEAIELFLAIVPWTRLQKLSLTGIALIEEVMEAVSGSLHSLRSLHLKALTLLSGSAWRARPIPHVVHPKSGVRLASRKAVAEASSYLKGHPLEELELEGFTMHLSLPQILHPKLRKLKLHLCELLPVPLHVKVLQVSDLDTLARQSPHIEHLEVDIGRIANLWHSTAVPGVDVDVRIYQILDTIATLPRLKRLRLLPPYWEVGRTWGENRLTQPLTDDAAVRLFRRLKEKSTSLEALAISSDSHVAAYLADFDPMSWELRASGEKVILTVRQANRDYEQRQVWIGERRLTTEIRRFSYQKPNIPEFEGGMIEY